MAVDSIEFPLIGKKLSGATIWQTSRQRGTNGEEVRNADWQDPLHRFNIAPGIKTIADQQMVETFHLACQGSAIGFLMRDYKDYTATHTATSLPAGCTQRGHVSSVGGSTTVFQLEKRYFNGARTYTRRITRPQSGTVQLYDASLNLIASGYTINYTTGEVTFAVAPAQPPAYWTGQFYVPVVFESDEIEWDLVLFRLSNKSGHGEMPDIILMEERE